jgi:hypothetical protein
MSMQNGTERQQNAFTSAVEKLKIGKLIATLIYPYMRCL